MSKLSGAVAEMKEAQKLHPGKQIKNYMGGTSYIADPLMTLKMVTASSIFGEPSYYRDGSYSGRKIQDSIYSTNSILREFDLLVEHNGKSTTTIMEETIDAALSFDFDATLRWAVELRKTYNMRLNPQVIMVRAAMHPGRKAWTRVNRGEFAAIQAEVMNRADEPATQLAYYMFKNKGKKNQLPSILKRSIASRLSSLGRYQVAKYKNHEIGIINAVRLTHAYSAVLSELMKTGTVEVRDTQKTWENLRSEGKSWVEILNMIDMGHMAMLRNLRNVFTEIQNAEFCDKYLQLLKEGVPNGKQFPFRYWSAMKAIREAGTKVNHQTKIITALEECIDLAVMNMPKLKGKTMCLSDNSGSAWGTFNSEYGSVTVAEIDNLSSVITAMCSDEGYVGKFGDTLKIFPVDQRNGALSQTYTITKAQSSNVGSSTEGGIWEFFRDAINNSIHWDNIFIYSDQQAGTGGLYGTGIHQKEYMREFGVGGSHINVFKLVLEYRKKVNPNVNVFSVQTAGYNNAVLPQYTYRTALLTGWTGKESSFAANIIDIWDGNK